MQFGLIESLTKALAEPAEELNRRLDAIAAQQAQTNNLLERLLVVETAKLTAPQERRISDTASGGGQQ
jgi:hypothetical protein